MNVAPRDPEMPYRMKDLCDRTGLPRQVIHFYIQQGLLPEGRKTGRNMAYYGEAHLERLKLIRQLQHERFLPLKAIRAVLEEKEDGFTKEQRRLLLDVKHRLGPLLASPPAGEEAWVPLHPLLLRSGVSRDEADELEKLGLLRVVRKGKRGGTGRLAKVAKEDAWMIEVWGEIRGAGFSRALGFRPSDTVLFAETMNAMFEKEAAMLKDRLSHLPPEKVARMVERAIPILNQFMARYHEGLVRKFFASIQG
jgi:DNA-binding transcriptional MerR regulator